MSKVKEQFDAVVGRDYKAADGSLKTHWINVGTVWVWQDGTMTQRLDAMPCFQGWDGKIQFFPKDRNKVATPPPARATAGNDEVPF